MRHVHEVNLNSTSEARDQDNGTKLWAGPFEAREQSAVGPQEDEGDFQLK